MSLHRSISAFALILVLSVLSPLSAVADPAIHCESPKGDGMRLFLDLDPAEGTARHYNSAFHFHRGKCATDLNYGPALQLKADAKDMLPGKGKCYLHLDYLRDNDPPSPQIIFADPVCHQDTGPSIGSVKLKLAVRGGESLIELDAAQTPDPTDLVQLDSPKLGCTISKETRARLEAICKGAVAPAAADVQMAPIRLPASPGASLDAGKKQELRREMTPPPSFSPYGHAVAGALGN